MVERNAAQPVADEQSRGGTSRGDDRRDQCNDDHEDLAARRSHRLVIAVQRKGWALLRWQGS